MQLGQLPDRARRGRSCLCRRKKPEPDLLPQPAGFDQRRQDRRGADAVGKRLVHHAAGVEGRVEPDHVVQRDRPHRHAELLGRPVDGLDLGAVGEQLQRLVHVRQQQAIDQKAGPVVDHDRRLADALGVGHGRGHRLVAGLRAANHFDQRHLPHGIEEVNAAEPLGPLQPLGQLRDRNRRGVRSQDRVGVKLRFEPGVELLLDLGVFDDRFDHQVARRQLGVDRGRFSSAANLHGLLRRRDPWSPCCRRLLRASAARLSASASAHGVGQTSPADCA